MQDDGGSVFMGFILLGILVGLYFLPGIVASNRKHPQQVAIWVLNILGGWTLVGWVCAIVWTFTNSQDARPVNVSIEPHAAANMPNPPAERDVPAEIERFAKLHAAGFLTGEEFAAKKRQLLSLDEAPQSAA
jgi:hypothetical protein